MFLHQQGLDTTTPAGRALFGMLGIFVEFERAIISERVLAGMARAKAQGKHVGRPALPEHKRKAIVAAYARTRSVRELARKFGVSRELVRRCVRIASSREAPCVS